MANKAQLNPNQLRDVDDYLGKLVHTQPEADEELCPTCQQPVVKQNGVVHRLLVVTGKTTGVYVPLPEGKVMTIGRGSACDLRLEDASASRQHAQVRGQEKFCVVRDLDSANGTLVNGKPVESKQLADGDVVQIGATRIIFYVQKD